MIKVVIIGAGSVVFTKNLTGDILSYPEFANAHFTYMDIDEQRLQVGVGLCRKIAKGLGANPMITGTMDRREAIRDADFVITTVQVGGFDSTLIDFDIPRKYGLNFTIADTTGPGGLFRALRTYPFFTGLVADMEELCPKAVLLNYSNPMSMNMMSITRQSSIQAVGLCHSVQGTFNMLMRHIGEDPELCNFICAGINHMAFYLSLERDGKDLYPQLFEKLDDKEIYESNQVRYELMRRLGYFVTESSEHNAEYCPYFIPRGHEKIEEFKVPIDEYLRRCDGIVEHFERLITDSQNDEPLEHHKSHEYGSIIINSIVTNTPQVVYGNMPNNGAIANLPDGAIVEAPTLVDRNGLQFTTVGELPPQLVGYVNQHVVQHELFIRGAMEGRRDHIYQACMYDPLTAATLSLDEIVDMCDEMIACHGDLLPPLEKSPRLVPFSSKSFAATPAAELRQRWQDRRVDDNDMLLRDWHVVGPFADVVPDLEGSDVDIEASYRQNGTVASFQAAKASIQGYFDATAHADDKGYLYAVTELDSVHGRETDIHIGSTSDITVWLNGKEVLQHVGERAFHAGENQSSVYLQEGSNRITVRLAVGASDSGFGVSVPKPDF